MTRHQSRLPITLVVILGVYAAPSAAFAQAGTITKGMQDNCANDYRKFCGDYGLQTSALNLCMKKAGPSLSPAARAIKIGNYSIPADGSTPAR